MEKQEKELIKNHNDKGIFDKNNAEYYNNRGDLYVEQEKYKEAIEDYNKAIKLDGKKAKYYCNRGDVYSFQGKYEEAIEDYDKAINLDNQNPMLYNGRGNAYYSKGEYEKSIKDYDKAIKLDNKKTWFYSNRGNAYYFQGKYEEAIKDYDEAIKLDNQNPIYYQLRGEAYYSIDLKKEAYSDYNEMIKLREESFYKYIIESKIEHKDILEIYRLYSKVMNLKHMLQFTCNNNLAHYTKMQNIQFLIKPKKVYERGKLRLNNASYMNDPTEGTIFLDLLKKDYVCQLIVDKLYNNDKVDKNVKQLVSGSHVFLVSFSQSIDESLPMWVQYSNDGTGCCIVLGTSNFDLEEKDSFNYTNIWDLSGDKGDRFDNKSNIQMPIVEKRSDKDDNKYSLYKIKYVEDNNIDEERINNSIKEIADCLKNFKVEDIDDSVKGILQDILDQVRFLFKDKTYEHEREVRVVKFQSGEDVEYTDAKEGYVVPHTYINLEKELDINEVILGPKAENPIHIANYLNYCGIKKVYKSKIKYQ